MSVKRLSISALAGWGVAVLAALAGRVALVNAPLSATEYAAWLFLWCAPAVIGLVIVRGITSSPSVSQVLYQAEHAGDAGREPMAKESRGSTR